MGVYKLDRPLSLTKRFLVTILCMCKVLEVVSDACNMPCTCEMKTEGLAVDCTSTELTAVPADIPEETVILKLSDNSIRSVSDEDFSYLKGLQRLYLDRNSLRGDMISIGAFQNLKNLQYLDLSDNRIKLDTNHVTVLLQPLTSLIWLDLGDNNINVMEQGLVSVFDRLQTLTLTGNILDCNCELLWFKNWLLNTRYAPPIINAAECYVPSSLRRQQVAYAEFCPGAGRCYQCSDALSNEECSSDIQSCTSDQDACQNVIRTSNGVKRISKGCKQLEACLNNNQGNLGNCNPDLPDSVCWHCCRGDLCNMPETAVVADGCREDQSPDQYLFRYPWPKVPNGVNAVTFQLRANNDGHVALADERVDKKDVIEIVLGGWSNSQSVIRDCKQCPALTTVSTPNLMSPTEDKHFYILFEGSVISVGIVGMVPFMSYQFESEPTINFIGISTGWGSSGDWSFCGYDTNWTPFPKNVPATLTKGDGGAIRLAGDSNSTQGHVEIFHRGKWGRICGSKWDIQSASVACRQLGFEKATAAFSSVEMKEDSTTSHQSLGWLDDVTCIGHEAKITMCQHRGWEYHKCRKSQYAFAVCDSRKDLKGKLGNKNTMNRSKRQAVATCPEGWHTYDEYCYYVSEERRTYEDAENECQEMYSTLTSIHSREEQEFISDLISGIKWIGLNDRDVEGTFTWTDGTRVDFLSWRGSEPNDLRGEDCAEMSQGLWNDQMCTDENGFICKMLTFTEINHLVCERDTFYLECPAGQTMYIKSALYGRRTSDTCPPGSTVTDCAATSSLDVVRDRCQGQQTCDILASNSVFGDPCVGTLKYLEIQYLCSNDKSLDRRRRQSEATCPSGWHTLEEYCYYVSSEQHSFDDAQNQCQEMDSTLASIHSLEEQEFMSVLVGVSSGRKWIGLNDKDVEGTFTWIDGTELDFQIWAFNQPDDKRGTEDCVHLIDAGSETGLWNDIPCSETFKYICKKSLADPEPSPDSSAPNQTESPAPEGLCTGKAGGLYPDPDDCNRFYACSDNGQSQFHGSCDEGLVFNPYCICCDWPHNYECNGISDFSCEGRHDGLYQDLDNCKAYFTCSDGQIVGRTICTEDTIFNPETQSCGWPAEYQCPLPTSSITYLGCYRDDETRALPDRLLNSDSMTPQLCFTFCIAAGLPYAGLQYAVQCFCGGAETDYGVYGLRDDSECNADCRGDADQKCGGAWRMNIYSISPILIPDTTASPTGSIVPVTGTIPVLPDVCYAEISNEGDKGRISWPETPPGAIKEVECPYQKAVGDTRYATRSCIWEDTTGAYWFAANVDDCPTDTEILEELADEDITEDNAEEVSDMLAVVTSNPDSLNNNDITNAVTTIEHLSDSIDTLSPATSPDILTNVLTTVNHMVDIPMFELEESQRADNTSTRILKTIDEFALGVQFSDPSIIQNTQAVDMAVAMIDNINLDNDILFRAVGSSNTNYQPELYLNFSLTGFDITDDDGLIQASVLLPNSLLQTVADDIDRCQFVLFQDTAFFEIIDVGGPTSNSQDQACNPSASDDSLKATDCEPQDEQDNQQDGDDDEIVTILNSVVISASVGDLEVNDLDEPATIKLRNINKDAFNPRCVFWDVSMKNGKGGWSEKGCRVNTKETSKTLTVCECDHLTNFAMIMDVYKDDSQLSRANSIALSVISYLGCAISFVALLLTVVTYTMCGHGYISVPVVTSSNKVEPECFARKCIPRPSRDKKAGKRRDRRSGRRDKRTKILLNLVVALLLVNFFFICGALVADYSGPGPACVALAIILHYFLLSAMIWMALEAFDMYMALVKVFESYYSHYLLKMCIAGWGLPIIPIAFTAGFDINNYGYHSGLCWLSLVPFYGAFLAPVCLILLFNSIVFIMVTKQLCDMRKRKITKSENFDSAAQLRASFSITFLLGLTWILAIFAVGGADLTFSYLFAIFNSLQGFSLFFFQCVLNTDIRNRWLRICCPKCAPPEDEPYPSNDATTRRITQQQKISTSSMSPLTVSTRISQFENGHTYDNSSNSYNVPTSYTNDNTYDNANLNEEPDYEAIQFPPRTTTT